MVEAAAHVVVEDLCSPALCDEDAHHLRSVLRLRAGSPVSATDGAGGFRMCRLEEVLVPVGEQRFVPRPAPAITVAFAPVKGERPEWAVQKLTELGVDRIVLVATRRGVVRWGADRAPGHLDRLRKVARAAVMQSRGCWMPSVEGMEEAASVLGGAGVAVCQPGGCAAPSLDRPTVLVGPEGGWDPAEVEQASSLGAEMVSLGPAVLRTETAAVVAGALLCGLRSGLVGALRSGASRSGAG